jgi:hypothetical protein
MIQGPLTIDLENRKWGICPRIDYGNIQGVQPMTLKRLLRWVDAGIVVQGRSDWRFVKIHTHGCDPGNAELLLGKPMRTFHQELAQYAQRRPNFKYHYVTAYEMAQLVHQAEGGAVAPTIPPKTSTSSATQVIAR